MKYQDTMDAIEKYQLNIFSESKVYRVEAYVEGTLRRGPKEATVKGAVQSWVGKYIKRDDNEQYMLTMAKEFAKAMNTKVYLTKIGAHPMAHRLPGFCLTFVNDPWLDQECVMPDGSVHGTEQYT